MMNRWKQKARELKLETYTLYYAYRHPGTPWYARAFTALVVVYAFSPIDLIPDFIPILGYLDDLLLIPLGASLALKMIPPGVMAECRARAQANLDSGKPQFKFMIVVILAIWLLVLAWVVRLLLGAG